MCVYFDETYCATQYRGNTSTWHDPTDPALKSLADPVSGGQRYVVVHAITKDGLLEVKEPAPLTAEYVFNSALDDQLGDYHNCFTSNLFGQWVKERLFPVFKAKYPGKKMVLIMDNCSSHKALAPTSVNLSDTQLRADFVSQLRSLGVTEISVLRKGKVVVIPDGKDKAWDRPREVSMHCVASDCVCVLACGCCARVSVAMHC